MHLILLGPPGTGKGTQAKLIAEELGALHVATGDLFRDAVKQGTELGKQAKQYMDRGDLVPDEVTIAMLLQRIQKPDAAGGVIFDGFPRTLQQAQALDEALSHLGDFDQRKSDVVELHYFGGLTYDEISAALEISPVTVHRELKMAKAWLRNELE